MRIARVTVIDGSAHVEIEGMDVPVIVEDGKTLSLTRVDMFGDGQRDVLQFEWIEDGQEKQLAIAAGPKS